MTVGTNLMLTHAQVSVSFQDSLLEVLCFQRAANCKAHGLRTWDRWLDEWEPEKIKCLERNSPFFRKAHFFNGPSHLVKPVGGVFCLGEPPLFCCLLQIYSIYVVFEGR